jgi:hypothetical protein
MKDKARNSSLLVRKNELIGKKVIHREHGPGLVVGQLNIFCEVKFVDHYQAVLIKELRVRRRWR